MNKKARKVRSEVLSKRTMGRRRAQISATEADTYNENEIMSRTTDNNYSSNSQTPSDGAAAEHTSDKGRNDTGGPTDIDSTRPLVGIDMETTGGGDPGPTLDQYFDQWIEYRRATAKKQVTPYRYEHWYRNHIRQPLGEKALRQLKRRDVIMLQSSMAATYHPSTVNYTVRVLKIILNDALAEGLIERNPAVGISPMRDTGMRNSTEKHRALTQEEQRLFVTAAKDSFYYEFFAFLLLTGMRHGEAAALTWKDVDAEGSLIHVSKTLTMDEGGHVAIGAPKSDSSHRDIPMTESIRKILESQRRKTLAALGKKRLPGSQWVFHPKPHPDHVLHNQTANEALQRVLRSMEESGHPIGKFSLHALRDTFATRFIEQGGSPQTLRTILGHSSLAITMDLYSHVLPNTKQQEMDRLEIKV